MILAPEHFSLVKSKYKVGYYAFPGHYAPVISLLMR